MDKAKELEKKYEWLQASEIYRKASDMAQNKKDIQISASLHEQAGYCLYRAARQAQTNIEFKQLMKQAIQAYKKQIYILGESTQASKQVKLNQAKAMIAFIQSRYETSLQEKKRLLEKWIVLERQVLEAYEKADDLHSFCKTGNDLLEFPWCDMIWFLKDPLKMEKFHEERVSLSTKVIQILSKLDDSFELARAHILATSEYSFAEWVTISLDEIIQMRQKCQQHLRKALELSKKTGDAWLISRSYSSAGLAAQFCVMDPKLAMEYGEKSLKYARICKDSYLMSSGYGGIGTAILNLTRSLEDPDKQRDGLEKAIEMQEKSIKYDAIQNSVLGFGLSKNCENYAYFGLAALESNPKTKRIFLEKAVQITREGIDHLRGYEIASGDLLNALSVGLRLLSETKSEIKDKRKLLNEALSQSKKYTSYLEEVVPHQLLSLSNGLYEMAFVHNKLAKIATAPTEKIEMLKNAVIALEKSVRLIAEKRKYLRRGWAIGFYFGRNYSKLGETLQKIFSLTEEEEKLDRAIEAYKQAASDYGKAEMPTHVAEAHWRTAQLSEERGRYQEAAKYYELASEAYKLAAKKIPQLTQFYMNHSAYMRAWSQIEQARASHAIEDYDKAKEHYKKATELHESSEFWSYLAPNYFAWSYMEKAEGLSRKEKAQLAKQEFQKALEQFNNAEESINQKLEEITSSDEKEMNQRLFEASDLRRKYCQARILLEDAKLLEREGKYLQSSKNYGEAAQKISAIADAVDVEAERKELKYIAILCQAWEKMVIAEETTSAESYLEAAKLFEKAKDYCFTKKASLWAIGNSSFCKGLASGTRYQDSMDLKENALAKRHMKRAATSYQQAGFKNASEYAKATLRLFDAYVFMNQAESEVDPEKKTKQYQMAENLLQIAAGSFMKAKQPEKTAQVKEILANVREEKTLAISLSQVMQAPTIASTTQSFTAPTPTSEASVGLESFEHANVQANLVANVKEVNVGESFCLSIEFVNAGREPALLTRVENFVPPDFVVVKKPEIYRLEETCLNMKGKQLAPLKLVEVKLTLQASKKGEYRLNPRVHYLDELGQNKTLQLKTLEIKVEEVLLEDRVSTGTQELDSLLLGGIPQEYAVVLTGSPSDERDLLIKNFLDAGIKEDQITFYVAAEADGLEHLLENPSFHLFLCNPKPKTQIPDLTNIYKLRSKTDLTNLSISLAKAHRNIDQSKKKRICVEIVSDVLISHKAENTRRWISELITDLGSKEFTMLAVMDPSMHPTDQANAVINLFDGEISITQTKDPLECKTSIRIEKLRNQDYIKNPICLTNK